MAALQLLLRLLFKTLFFCSLLSVLANRNVLYEAFLALTIKNVFTDFCFVFFLR